MKVPRPVRQGLRAGFVVLALGLLARAVAGQWHSVVDALHRMGVLSVLWSLLAAVVGLAFTMLAWRAILADLGSRLPLRAALRMFFLSQLGKYMPGTVWPYVAQMQMGREHGIPRRRSGVTGLVFVGLHCTTGLLVASALLPFASPHAAERYWWVLGALPVFLIVLHPRVLTPLLGHAFRLLRREPLDKPLSLRGTATACGFLLVTWCCYGLSVFALLAPLGVTGPRGVAIAIGGYGLAWSAGVMFLGLAPAGVGVREAALIAALLPVLPIGPATAVAAISRVVQTLGDASWGLVALLVRGRTTEWAEPPVAVSEDSPSRSG